MPRYSFTICHGDRTLPSSVADCPDDEAAKREAAGVFADLARDIANELHSKSTWQIVVLDDAGSSIFKIKLTVESE